MYQPCTSHPLTLTHTYLYLPIPTCLPTYLPTVLQPSLIVTVTVLSAVTLLVERQEAHPASRSSKPREVFLQNTFQAADLTRSDLQKKSAG